MSAPAAPSAGEIVWLDFSPQVGHEQAGRRPALVLSPQRYNEPVGLALCCPVTSKAKGYVFELPLPEGCGVKGVVLTDQVRSLDWRGRRAEPAGRVPEEVLEQARHRVRLLLEP